MFIQNLILRLLNVYSMIIIIRVVFSWFVANPQNQIYIVLTNLTEPVLGVIRKQLRRIFPAMMLDFSPFIAIIIIQFLERLVIQI